MLLQRLVSNQLPREIQVRKGKKRSRLVAEEPLLNDAMVSFLKDSNETLSTMADSMGYSKEL